MRITRIHKSSHQTKWMFLKRKEELKQRTKQKILEDADEFYGLGFKNPLMVLQLAKIIDSEGNPVELNSVQTDDDKTIRVSMEEAKILHSLYYMVDTKRRREFTEDWQNSETFTKYLSKLK